MAIAFAREGADVAIAYLSESDDAADMAWKRPAQPVELAPAFVFFASTDSRFCTGEILAVTGGSSTR